MIDRARVAASRLVLCVTDVLKMHESYLGDSTPSPLFPE
jgi:hypothetical protein